MTCQACAKFRRQMTYENQEVAQLRRHLQFKGGGPDLHQELRDRIAHRDGQRALWDEHRASDDCTGEQRRPARAPRPVKVDDRERCPVCHRPQNPLPTGFLRKHNDPQGYPCSNRRRATTTETRTA